MQRTNLRQTVEAFLIGGLPSGLVSALLDAHDELRTNFYMGRLRPSELEGGRFAEAAVRLCQHATFGRSTPLSNKLASFDRIVRDLEQSPKAAVHDSYRIHIPRVLLGIYNVRNRRDVGHLSGDVIANKPDAQYVVSACDWVLAELIRLNSLCSLSEAQRTVDTLVDRKIPIVQEFQGFLKVLRPELPVPDKIMVLLYSQGAEGATKVELRAWLKPASEAAVRMSLTRLEHTRGFIHCQQLVYVITLSGARHVERNLPLILD